MLNEETFNKSPIELSHTIYITTLQINAEKCRIYEQSITGTAEYIKATTIQTRTGEKKELVSVI